MVGRATVGRRACCCAFGLIVGKGCKMLFVLQVEKLMPNDTFYFSILRSPVTWMESSFAYYKDTARAFSNVKSLEQFLEDPWSHYLPTSRGSHYARNCMWFDFGFDHNADDTPAYVDSVISKIANTFHLILIAEYFDQSMVLLQEALCWDLDDVLSFKLNPRGNGTVVPLSETTADQIPAWNSLDWKLYLHFNRTFWQKVDLFGRQRMSEEVVLLQEARQKMRDLCLERGRPVDPSQILDKTIKPFQFGQARIQGYNLNTNLTPATRERCLRMILPELHYKDLLDAKAHPPAAHPPAAHPPAARPKGASSVVKATNIQPNPTLLYPGNGVQMIVYECEDQVRMPTR